MYKTGSIITETILPVSNFFKFKMSILSNPKTGIGRMNKNKGSNSMLSIRDQLEIQRHKQVESQKNGEIYFVNIVTKRAEVATLIHTTYALNQKGLKEQRRSLYFNKGSILQEDVTFINIYAPNDRSSK